MSDLVDLKLLSKDVIWNSLEKSHTSRGNAGTVDCKESHFV